jgi:regulator of sigma E protease
MTIAIYLIAILGLAVLMVVHEGGHYVAARAFGMRVTRFSIGFGPTIWRHKPKDGETVYQVALIPFLAYVQIAGMNPYEEIDPKDKASYANASVLARIVTIAAGPLTNYFFASVLIFFGLLIGGRELADETSMRVVVEPGPAQAAGVRTGDRVLTVNGEAIGDWVQLKKSVSSHPGEPVDVAVMRGSDTLHLTVTPKPVGDKDAGLIRVTPPRQVVPVGIVKETAKQAKIGAGVLLQFLGMLSAYLGAFNLLPFPALDGGRLIFLAAEAVSRRKADAKIEARVHAVGLLMLLTLIAFVTYADVIAK